MDLLTKYFPELSDTQLKLFGRYKELFLEWNSKINLVSRKDTENFVQNHLIHSLSIAKFIRFQKNTSVLDVGTGGGLPGIPLAIYFPHTDFTLVDSIGKKIKVVNDLAIQLELQNVTAFQERMELVNGKFDFIVSRAVAPIKKIDHWVGNKFKSKSINALPNGFILLKGGDLSEEIEESELMVETTSLKSYFEEAFFETKKIIYIAKK